MLALTLKCEDINDAFFKSNNNNNKNLDFQNALNVLYLKCANK